MVFITFLFTVAQSRLTQFQGGPSEIKSQFHLMYHEETISDYSHGNTMHSDLNYQNLFHSAIDTPPGGSGGQKIQENFLNMNFTV